jgi:ankyrin repeat protein
MHLLAINNSPNLAKQLSRDIFRIDMEIMDRDGNTPFMAAVRYDSSHMVQYFLQIGYRPDKKEKDGNTPLHVAIRSMNFATIKLLAQRPHLNVTNDDGRSPLAAAVAIGNEMATDILWRADADPNIIDKAGNTLLLLACAGPSIVILKHVLEHCSEVRTQNVAGDTALDLASVSKGPNIIFELCKRGANVTAQDCLGRTPLMIAIMSSNRQAAAVQLEWQFAVGTDLLVKVDSQGLNASQYCDLFADQETKESIRKLETALRITHQNPVQTRTIYFNAATERIDVDNEDNDPLADNSDDSTNSSLEMPVLTL